MVQEIDCNQLRSLVALGGPLRILDVRTPGEFAAGHLPGAVNFPLDSLRDSFPGVEPDEPIVVVCKSGMRSGMACARVAKSYRTVYQLKGGTDGWAAAGCELEF